MTTKARLDTDRTAKPLTELVARVDAGKCFHPRGGNDLTYRETAEARGSHVHLCLRKSHEGDAFVIIRSVWREP